MHTGNYIADGIYDDYMNKKYIIVKDTCHVCKGKKVFDKGTEDECVCPECNMTGEIDKIETNPNYYKCN